MIRHVPFVDENVLNNLKKKKSQWPTLRRQNIINVYNNNRRFINIARARVGQYLRSNGKIKRVFSVLFLFFPCSCTCSVPTRRRKTAEETAFEHRHDGDGTFDRVLAVRRDNHFVVHVQPATASTVGRSVHRAGAGARGTVQLGRAAARQLPAGDQRPVGQVQRFGHGDDHHENRKVSATRRGNAVAYIFLFLFFFFYI